MFVKGLAVLALALLPALPAKAAAQDSPIRSVEDGVYTEEQATRGKAAFDASCTLCHELEQFTSDEFKENWAWGEVFWLVDYLRMNMPYEMEPLPRQMYLDVVAYILQLNEFPAGGRELPQTDEGLMGIVFPDPVPVR